MHHRFPSLIAPVAPIFGRQSGAGGRAYIAGAGVFGVGRYLTAAATLLEEVAGGKGTEGGRGRLVGGRLHNGGEENKAWKAWRLAGAASALPDTPPLPSASQTSRRGKPKHHNAVPPFPLLA